jgi:succinoglycan biosynthesis transport protein ExoP
VRDPLSNIPTFRESPARGLSEPLEPISTGDAERGYASWGAIIRNRWLILACPLAVVAITLVLTKRAVPIYEGSSTLRIEQKEPNLLEAFRSEATDSRLLPTEMEELRSRGLAAGVVKELGLRLALLEPRVRRRSDLLRDVRVSDSAVAAEYRLVRGPGGRFVLRDELAGKQLAEFSAEGLVEFRGFSFVLTASARQHSEIRFGIGTLTDVTLRESHNVSVTQPRQDVNIVKVSYRSRDQELAWQVPQALVTNYIGQRQQLQSLKLRSTIDFLRQQIATISEQLGAAERKLQSYRARSEMINPEAEATGQVGRLVSMQTQLAMLEEERGAIAALLAEVDTEAVEYKPGDPSPYRRLLAFPTLLQSQAATGLLQSLSEAEDEREALLTRRTHEDSDVKRVDQRIQELERELRAIAATYHQGVTKRVQSLDSSLAAFQQQLRHIPEKELQYARLERQPKVLEGVYTMLQTRLKEAEVAVAARDANVRIVDAAIPPTRPVWPNPVLNAMGALVGGLLLGVGAAFTREYRDRAIRTRVDVRGSTGLPVIGMIPRIPKQASPVALNGRLNGGVKKHGRRHHSLPPLLVQLEQPTPPPSRALTISTKAGLVSEAYGILQTNIAFSRQEAPAKTLVFTSPFSGEGKTTTVINLGVSLAQRGIRVLLIDADVRRGVLHSVFGGVREPGLSEVLKGIAPFESTRRSVSVGKTGILHYLTTGKLYPGDSGLVTSEAMRNLLAWAREEYDLVIVDAPPVNIISDAAVLAATADGAVLLVRAGVTEASALNFAVEQLRHVRADVLGVILNDIDLRRDSAYDSAYKYFRAYEYSTNDG